MYEAKSVESDFQILHHILRQEKDQVIEAKDPFELTQSAADPIDIILMSSSI